jgi:hypothetical protein
VHGNAAELGKSTSSESWSWWAGVRSIRVDAKDSCQGDPTSSSPSPSATTSPPSKTTSSPPPIILAYLDYVVVFTDDPSTINHLADFLASHHSSLSLN